MQLKCKNPTERLDETYLEKAEDKRRKREPPKNPPLQRGRVTTAGKIKLAQRTEAVYSSDKALGLLGRSELGVEVNVAYQVYGLG